MIIQKREKKRKEEFHIDMSIFLKPAHMLKSGVLQSV